MARAFSSANERGPILAAIKQRGWLYKRGHWRQNWTRRYCEMEEDGTAPGEYVLRYYKVDMSAAAAESSDFKKPAPQGFVPLLGATVFPRAGDGHPFGFSVSARPLRSDSVKAFPFRASSFEDRRVWLECLELLISASSRAHAHALATRTRSAVDASAAAEEAQALALRGAQAADLAQGEEALKEAKAEEVKLLFALAASRAEAPGPESLVQAHGVVALFGRAVEIFDRHQEDDRIIGKRDERGGLVTNKVLLRKEVAAAAMKAFLQRPQVQALLERGTHGPSTGRSSSVAAVQSGGFGASKKGADVSSNRQSGSSGSSIARATRTLSCSSITAVTPTTMTLPSASPPVSSSATVPFDDFEANTDASAVEEIAESEEAAATVARPPPKQFFQEAPTLPADGDLSTEAPTTYNSECLLDSAEPNVDSKPAAAEEMADARNEIGAFGQVAATARRATVDRDTPSSADARTEELLVPISKVADTAGGGATPSPEANSALEVDAWMLPDISEDELEGWHGNQDPLAIPPPPPPPPDLPSGGGGLDVAYYRQSVLRRQSSAGDRESLPALRALPASAAHAQNALGTSLPMRKSDDVEPEPQEEEEKGLQGGSAQEEDEDEGGEIGEVALPEEIKVWEAMEVAAEAVGAASDSVGRAWLAAKGFDPHGDGRDLKRSKRFPLHTSTPLFEACAGGHLSVLKWLWFSLGAGPEDALKADRYGNTPLHMAVCEGGSVGVASWLLRRLTLARNQHREVVACQTHAPLTPPPPSLSASEKGAPSLPTDAEATAAAEVTAPAAKSSAMAIGDGCGGCGGAFDHGHASLANNFGSTPLLNACQRGHLCVAKWLIHRTKAALDVRRPNNSGWTPLLIACHKGQLPVVEWLVNRDERFAKTCMFARNNAGSGPVLAAAAQGHAPLLSFLCEKALERALANRLQTVTAAAAAAMSGRSIEGQEAADVCVTPQVAEGAAEGASRDVARLLAQADKYGESPFGAVCKVLSAPHQHAAQNETARPEEEEEGKRNKARSVPYVEAALVLLRFGLLSALPPDQIAAVAARDVAVNEGARQVLVDAIEEQLVLVDTLGSLISGTPLSPQPTEDAPNGEGAGSTANEASVTAQQRNNQTCLHLLAPRKQLRARLLVLGFLGLPTNTRQSRHLRSAVRNLRIGV